MANAVNFQLGSIYPYDPNKGLSFGIEAIQKWLPVTLDTYFNDSVTGATCSRAITVSTDGFVTLEFADNSTATLPMVSGIWYVTRAYRVHTTGTNATGIFWGY